MTGRLHGWMRRQDPTAVLRWLAAVLATVGAACTADVEAFAAVKGRKYQLFGLWYCLVFGSATCVLSCVLAIALQEHATVAALVAFPSGALGAYVTYQGWRIIHLCAP